MILSAAAHIFVSATLPTLAVYTPYYYVAGGRFVMGVTNVSAPFNPFLSPKYLQGVFFPPIAVLISEWYAHREKTSASMVVYSGIQIGSLLTFPLGALLCPMRDLFGGWPLMFYSCGERLNAAGV